MRDSIFFCENPVVIIINFGWNLNHKIHGEWGLPSADKFRQMSLLYGQKSANRLSDSEYESFKDNYQTTSFEITTHCVN